jgi:hypothetical protein
MKASTVPNGAKQGAETLGIPGVEALIWTERMVSALVNGVEGGKWYSLMDKVYAPKTLRLAWDKVRANRGAAGVDGQKKSLSRIKDRIREKTRRTRGESLARIIADLNPTLRGWFGYFKHAHSSTFRKLDGFIRRRFRALLRKQEKRPGFGRCLADQQRWNNAFFAAAGLFALYPAWQAERDSR